MLRLVCLLLLMGCAPNEKVQPKLVHKYKREDVVYVKPDSLRSRVFYVWPDKLAYTVVHIDSFYNAKTMYKEESELY
jgi:hypothetical protein